MRGIQINNYFNNHITLNGKKIEKDPQSIAPTSRQKLNHVASNPQEDPTPADIKASPVKQISAPLKKRTNTVVELKKHLPLKRSVSVQRQRNAASAKKKEDLVSDSEEKDEEHLINMSQKKFRPNATKGGLGKRSKSTIIKTHEPHQKDFPKKESKKLNSNPTTESSKPIKSKRKKSSKISAETARDNKQTITTKHSTARKEPAASKQIFKKEKLVLKLDKNFIKSDKPEKKSARNHVKNLINPSAKSSKPVSAREKKVNKNRFIEELKEKYENQTILEDQLGSSRLQNNEENNDNQFLSVMSSLEKILTSVGSKQKLKKDLEIINEKLREFRLETEEEEHQFRETSSNKKSSKIEDMVISLENDLLRQEGRRGEEAMSEGDQEEEEEEEPLMHKMSEEQDEILMRLEGEEVKNPLIGKRNHNVFFVQEKSEEQTDDRRREIQLLKKFKSESTKMMEKVGLTATVVSVNTQKIDIEEHLPPQHQRKLTLDNISEMSYGSIGHNGSKWQDKYPSALPARSPRFDESQLLGAIELKEQFLSSKRDKMSELVRRMFEKQLVSPRSYQFQMKSLDRRYQQENQQLENMRKQAEQLSSMLSEIKKDKEEIQGIDELIRNEKWEEAQRLVQQEHHSAIVPERPLPTIAEREQLDKWQRSPSPEPKQARWEVLGWEKEGGWERVRIGKSEVEGNEFVETGELTNRGRRVAEAHLDIDEECGGTEESQELQPHEVRADHQEDEEYIYYQEDNEQDKKELEGGLIRLVQVSEQSAQESTGGGVFHIKEEEGVSSSMLSAPSQPQRGGFVTNLYFIKEYCIAICEFVRDNDTFKAQFRHNISHPLHFDLPALLVHFRQEEGNYAYTRRTHRPAIPSVIWDEFNSQYETLKLHSASNRETEKYRLEKEQELVFVRMIYEVLNESLDHERPGGQFGRALPWREAARHLKNLKQLTGDGENVQAYDLMFGVAIARIIQWGSCLCGFLPDTVELENTEIDDAYVNHIRQTRTAFLLEKMMAEEEAIMTNFELEEAEVQYRLGQMVFQELLEEAETDLACIF